MACKIVKKTKKFIKGGKDVLVKEWNDANSVKKFEKEQLKKEIKNRKKWNERYLD